MENLQAIIADLPEDKRQVASSLAEEITFMQATLAKLRAHVEEYGAVEWYENGRQKCWKESAALKSYNVTLKSYNATIKQLAALLPEDSEQGDELDEWLQSH